MATRSHQHEYAEVPGSGHERTDLDLTGLFRLIVFSVVALVGVFVAMWVMFRALQTREAGLDSPPPPLAAWEPGKDRLPAGPLLQRDEPGDLRKFRASEDAILNTYGWVDKTQGTVRVPISRAMELVLERGVAPPGPPVAIAPVPPPGQAAPTPGQAAPTPGQAAPAPSQPAPAPSQPAPTPPPSPPPGAR